MFLQLEQEDLWNKILVKDTLAAYQTQSPQTDFLLPNHNCLWMQV